MFKQSQMQLLSYKQCKFGLGFPICNLHNVTPKLNRPGTQLYQRFPVANLFKNISKPDIRGGAGLVLPKSSCCWPQKNGVFCFTIIFKYFKNRHAVYPSQFRRKGFIVFKVNSIMVLIEEISYIVKQWLIVRNDMILKCSEKYGIVKVLVIEQTEYILRICYSFKKQNHVSGSIFSFFFKLWMT